MGGKPRARGWLDLNDPKYQKTCTRCGETWNDRLVDHECPSLLALCERIYDYKYGAAPIDPSIEELHRLARTLLRINSMVRPIANAKTATGSVNHTLWDLAKEIAQALDEK